MVHALTALIDTPDEITGPVNLGNPTEVTIRQLAEKIVAMTGTRSEIVSHPLPEDDPRQRQPEISLARKLLGWSPSVGLEQGLAKTIDHFRKRLSDESEP